MTDKFAFIRCPNCKRDNRVSIEENKQGHYQCGNCHSYLMFYGKKDQSFILPIFLSFFLGISGYIGYKHYTDEERQPQIFLESKWTARQTENFKSACKHQSVLSYRNWSSGKIADYCDCAATILSAYDVSFLEDHELSPKLKKQIIDRCRT